jgi:hypothetical protein
MKTNPESNPDDPLLDAVLRDDAWASLNAATKAAALRELAAQNRRQHWAWLSAAAGLAACLAAATFWPTSPLPSPQLAARTPPIQLQTQNPKLETSSSAPTDNIRHISEAEMLALFPKGSCVIATINNQEQLVFFDHEIEAHGAPYHPGS